MRVQFGPGATSVNTETKAALYDTAAGRSPVIVVDDFLPLDAAEQIRSDFEAHFSAPHEQTPETHGVWNYWYVDQLYAYLRAPPEKVLAPDRLAGFRDALGAWAFSRLGLGRVLRPYLSLYLPGCGQGLHNDTKNGRFAYVYSLTRNARRTSGGETLIFREGDPFRANLAGAQAGSGFYRLVEPRFNRLVVFDDRLPHAVQRIEGVMHPLEGRVVLHGHIVDSGQAVSGSLDATQVADPLIDMLVQHGEAIAARAKLWQGLLVLRFEIDASGAVQSCVVLVDRVFARSGADADWNLARRSLITQILSLRFAAADGPSSVTIPLRFGSAPPSEGAYE